MRFDIYEQRCGTQHDLLFKMSQVIADVAEINVARDDNSVPTTLISDFAAYDVPLIEKHGTTPFLWHVHWAGTYIHFLDRDSLQAPTFESWAESFLKWDDWTFTELNYRWCGKSDIYYYDGVRFRLVSRETALLIWQYYGKHIIEQHYKTESAAVTA